MPIENIKKLTAEQKAKLDAALKEFDVMVDEITASEDGRVAAELAKVQLEANLETVNKDWRDAYEEVERVSKDYQASEMEKANARADLEKARREKVEVESKLVAALGRKPEVDSSKFLSREDYDKQRSQDARNQTVYWGDTLDAVAEIERVTKNRVSPKTLIQEALAAKKTPLEYAEEKYKLKEEREKQAKEAQDKIIAEAEKRGYEKGFGEAANPHTRPMEDSRQPFYVPLNEKDAAASNPWDETGSLKDDPIESTLKSDPDLADKFAESVKVTRVN